MKKFAKHCLHAVFIGFALPLAAVAGFGRFDMMFSLGAQACALIPGIVGDYFRIAFYKLTLQQSSMESRISFGSFFAHSKAALGRGVYIGSYCILGHCTIGERTQIASQVQILSGRRQHDRTPMGQITGSLKEGFDTVHIGADCWIGAAAVVMASVGDGTTVGAGSVVVQPIPSHVVAVGNPARVVSSTTVTACD